MKEMHELEHKCKFTMCSGSQNELQRSDLKKQILHTFHWILNDQNETKEKGEEQCGNQLTVSIKLAASCLAWVKPATVGCLEQIQTESFIQHLAWTISVSQFCSLVGSFYTMHSCVDWLVLSIISSTYCMWICIASKASRPEAASTVPDPLPRKVTLAPVSCWMWFK